METIGQMIKEVFQKISKLFLSEAGEQPASQPVVIRNGKMRIKEFVKTYYPYAKEIENDSGVPAVFILAQAALETEWNKHRIGNNLFGITARVSEENKRLVKTWEILPNPNYKFPVILSVKKIGENQYKYRVKRWFRDYDTPTECFRDHLEVLRKPWFKEAFNHLDDPYKFADWIAYGDGKHRYATAPNYGGILKSIIKTIEPYIKQLEK